MGKCPLKLNGKTRVTQEFKDQVTVGNIVSRYSDREINRVMRDSTVDRFGDFVDKDASLIDFHSALNTVTRVREMFDKLPSQVRARFSNDPVELIQFVQDPANREEGEKLGVFKKRAEKPPEEVKNEKVDPPIKTT